VGFPGRRLLVASLALSVAASSLRAQHDDASCCEPVARPLPPLPETATDKEKWLRRIHDEVATYESNRYLHTKYIDELRAQLNALGDHATPLERADKRFNLALATIRIGAVDETIRLLEEAVAFVEQDPRQNRAMLSQILFRLAVAHFRAAEKANCIANHNSDSCIMPLSARAVHRETRSAEAARATLDRMLALQMPQLRQEAIWLYNITHMALGTWPDGVPAEFRLPNDRLGVEAPIGRFVDVARELGLARHGHAGSVTLEDFTGDGRLDVLSTKFDLHQPLQLSRNNGDGTFTDVTAEAGLALQLGGVNVVHADVDNDGLLDLLVLRGGGFDAPAEFPNSLLRQDRPGHFVDITKEAGVEVAAPSRTGAFADIDRDGDLDLFLGFDSAYLYPGSGTGPDQPERYPAKLFRNDGNCKFTDISAASGIRNPQPCAGALFADIDDDGYPDLFLSNFMSRNRLYMNRGDGTFVLDTNARGVGGWRETGPSGFFDHDNDGDLDLFMTSCRHIYQIRAVCSWYHQGRIEGTTQELFENDGKGTFKIVTDARGLRRTVTSTSMNLGDVDNDGFVDMYIGTGADDFAALFPNVLLLNGPAGFRDVSVNAGVGHLQKCHGIAMGDLDDDGDLDMALSVGGFYQDDTFGNVLFKNPGNGNHWLDVELRGVTDNRFGLGARVQVRVAGEKGPRDLYQWIGMGASFGCNPLRAHFGLGASDKVEFVEVRWPAKRELQRVEGVPIDGRVRIEQGKPGFETIARSPMPLGN